MTINDGPVRGHEETVVLSTPLRTCMRWPTFDRRALPPAAFSFFFYFFISQRSPWPPPPPDTGLHGDCSASVLVSTPPYVYVMCLLSSFVQHLDGCCLSVPTDEGVRGRRGVGAGTGAVPRDARPRHPANRAVLHRGRQSVRKGRQGAREGTAVSEENQAHGKAFWCMIIRCVRCCCRSAFTSLFCFPTLNM